MRFQNIRARSENGVLVHGWAPEHVQGIDFENVHIELAKWSKWPGGQLDLRPCPGADNGYGSGVIDHPTHGFLIQKARDITLRHCSVAWAGEKPAYFKEALVTDRVEGLVLDDFKSA